MTNMEGIVKKAGRGGKKGYAEGVLVLGEADEDGGDGAVEALHRENQQDEADLERKE